MQKPSIILIGAGGHARSCIDVIEQEGKYQIEGLIGTAGEMGSCHLGYRVIGTDLDLPRFVEKYRFAHVAVGQIKSSEARIAMHKRLCQIGFELPAIHSPLSHSSPHASIGCGTILMHGAIVNAGAAVGEMTIINTRALVEHDATVGGYCHISTGAILNGEVRVGECSFIGSGCVVKERITIGRGCVVGMGLTVRRNIADRTSVLSNM